MNVFGRTDVNREMVVTKTKRWYFLLQEPIGYILLNKLNDLIEFFHN